MTKKEKLLNNINFETAKKIYVIIEHKEKDGNKLQRMNLGFNIIELLGVLEVTKSFEVKDIQRQAEMPESEEEKKDNDV
jgi:hypothetical protein